MVESETLSNLENIVSQLGIQLRYEKGDFQGGVCRLKDERILIINKSLQIQKKIEVIANELSQIDLSGVYIIPVLRELLEKTAETQSHREV
jgi:hypothetical protein